MSSHSTVVEQALAQACAVCSPWPWLLQFSDIVNVGRVLSVIAIFRQLSTRERIMAKSASRVRQLAFSQAS